MKKIVLTEEQLLMVIRESVKDIMSHTINEDGGFVGGGAAANGSGFMNGANNAQTSSNAQYDVPFNGVMRKKGYSPKDPSLKRHDGKGGSISIPKNRA